MNGFNENGQKHGYWETYYFYDPTSNIESEGNYKNGLKNGLWKFYYINGSLDREVQYVKGIKYGLCTSYFDNGQIYEEVNYINDQKHGLLIGNLYYITFNYEIYYHRGKIIYQTTNNKFLI